MGVSWDEALRMPWGMTRMLFESRAEAWEASNGPSSSNGTRYATEDDYSKWI